MKINNTTEKIIINNLGPLKSCDYLVLNDGSKKAFFIELKGSNVSEAIPQFEGAIKKLSSELLNYSFKFRIISSKCKTHEIMDSKITTFKKKYGSEALIIKTQEYKENIKKSSRFENFYFLFSTYYCNKKKSTPEQELNKSFHLTQIT